MSDPTVVAYVYETEDTSGEPYDEVWTWEAAQTYALHDGAVIVAVADDGHMSKEDIQALCDAERARHIDCFGRALGIEREE